MSGGIRRTKLDIIFSTLIRERAEWSCQFPGCGFFFPEGETAGLDCSHIEGRRKRSVRWHPDNALAMCKYHHRYLGENPLMHADLVKKLLGKDLFIELKRRAHSLVNFTPRQIEGLYQHYVAEYERMTLARKSGRLGRIDFSWPDPIPEATPRTRKKAKPKSKYLRKVGGRVVLRGSKVNVNGSEAA